MKELSVDKAFQRGFLINLPVFIIMFSPIILGVIFMQEDSPILYYVLLAVMGFILAWLFWSVTVPYWKVWAFARVRNVHELWTKAVDGKLIWPEGHFFEKTEIWTPDLKKRWIDLEKKFAYPDVRFEDTSLPKEFKITFSKTHLMIELISAVFTLMVGIYGIIFTEQKIIGAVLAILSVSYLPRIIRKKSQKFPDLVISDRGIYHSEFGFFTWEEVKNESLSSELEYDDGFIGYLKFNTPEKHHSISMKEYDYSHKQLETALFTYRERWKRQR